MGKHFYSVISLVIITKLLFSGTYEYIGCYTDTETRDLSYFQEHNALYTIEKCANLCQRYRYFALQFYGNCFCGNTYGTHGKVSESECDHLCSSDNTQYCGAAYKNSVYANSVSPTGRIVESLFYLYRYFNMWGILLHLMKRFRQKYEVTL